MYSEAQLADDMLGSRTTSNVVCPSTNHPVHPRVAYWVDSKWFTQRSTQTMRRPEFARSFWSPDKVADGWMSTFRWRGPPEAD